MPLILDYDYFLCTSQRGQRAPGFSTGVTESPCVVRTRLSGRRLRTTASMFLDSYQDQDASQSFEVDVKCYHLNSKVRRFRGVSAGLSDAQLPRFPSLRPGSLGPYSLAGGAVVQQPWVAHVHHRCSPGLSQGPGTGLRCSVSPGSSPAIPTPSLDVTVLVRDKGPGVWGRHTTRVRGAQKGVGAAPQRGLQLLLFSVINQLIS